MNKIKYTQNMSFDEIRHYVELDMIEIDNSLVLVLLKIVDEQGRLSYEDGFKDGSESAKWDFYP